MTDASGPGGPEATTLPLFPLHTVLLPGVHLPLSVFEPRYRQLTVDLMTGTVPDRLFGVVALRHPGVREVETTGDLAAIGCAARLREAERHPDGRFEVITTGVRRFRVLDLDTHTACYLTGHVEWIDDTPVPDAAAHAAAQLAGLARAAHHRYCARAWEGDDAWRSPPEDVPPAELAYLLAADCLLPLADRQDLLEQRHPLRRLRAIRALLTREEGILSALHAVPASHDELDGETGILSPAARN
ncbi:LON peptidase substrate-binding domain-containing protein [Saccharomonospora iraqiensis]|uniref:LON peptidase substrate-binding domain-containing protein n=1 Tax=Saccharomonospora iraqiensis TaxID=52698 RepID=UPI00022DE960|nr:LON peptidase substrate-binding domain-containing protein [Saccharomonospora iraqiensis]